MMIGTWRVLEAADAGQHPVEQDQVGQRLLDHALGALGIEGGRHFVAGAPQVDGDQRLDRRFVFDYEYRGSHGVGNPVEARQSISGR